MKLLIDFIRKYREIIEYLFWGIMTTLISWGSYSLFELLFHKKNGNLHFLNLQISAAVFWANLLSWICAVLFAFFVNKLFVFKSRSFQPAVCASEFGKFVSARLLTGILEIVVVPMLVAAGLNQTILGVEGLPAKILVSVAVIILNYIFSKLFVFHS